MATRAVMAAAAAGLALVTTAGVSFARSEATSRASAAEIAASRAQADSLSARLARLETALGIVERAESRTDEFRARYASLRRRELAVAHRAEQWLRFVPSGAPVHGGVITSAFSPGRYHPIRHRVIPHVGLDIGAPLGAPVSATADGTVKATVNNPTYGLTVDLEHGRSGFLTRYAHLLRIVVRPGDTVLRGDTIGYVGSTGLSTGPHTHYEVFFLGWRRDPIDFLPPSPVAAAALLGAD